MPEQRNTLKSGEWELRSYQGVTMGMAYCCPGCGCQDYVPIGGPDDWQWNFNEEAPSLSPSLLHRPCGWHGYMTAGKLTAV